ncbi:kinesin-like protein KIF18B [Strigops habroptila]|uniref:kinesin-like protein KIF18B n=1 Tax=Strigops habroptila TaxID=2489341 RepID=UPI0011CF4BF6|nr:kinesin-like protein KIF18B [Strigops habroptila]
MVLCPPPEEGTVAVVVRVRPLAPCECERAVHPVLHVVGQHVIVLNPEEPGGPPGSLLPLRGPKQQGKELKFVFDRVFGEEATQEEVFQHTTSEVLDSVLNGYNCSVFAYGATGAGKTYTMLGSEHSPGIMYFTMVELYKRIEARKEEKSCEVLISYQEVYNEQIYDLLEPKGPLAIREDPERGVVVQGLSFHQPASAEQLLEMLANGNKNRTQHPTDANAASSRSHAIFQIYVKQQDRVGSLTRDLKVAKMSLIDLAGSERASVANTRGERLREGANINRSLLALINVINALADAKSKKSHIPYRDSKLTRLLKDSIGGNCRTVMVAAVSPSMLAYEDTYNTLKYASRAKEIKLSLKSNTRSSDCHICEYVEICEQLKGEVADLRAKLRAYEDAGQEAENQAPAPQALSSLSPVQLPRLEEAVPKTGLALDDQRVNAGGEQELEAGLPVQMQLELEDEAPEEMPPSSPRASHRADLQLEPEQPRLGRNSLLQGLSRTEKPAAAILSAIQKLYSILKAANLLTPGVVSVLEELEHLVPRDAGVSPEQAVSLSRPTEVSGATPAKRMKWSCDAEASVTMPIAPVTSATLQCLQQPAPFFSHGPMASSPNKRRKSQLDSASPSGRPCSVKRQMKRQQGCGKAAEIPRTQSPGTPWLEAEAQTPPGSPVPPCYTRKTCPAAVTKSRVPLATSAAQNRCSLPAHDLNVTFEVCEESRAPSTIEPVSISLSEFPVWENSQCLRKKQDGPFMPKAPIPMLAMKNSSLPKASVLKRRRVESIAFSCLGELQSCTAQHQSSSKRWMQPSRIPERRCGAGTRKGSKKTPKELAPVLPAPTPQPMKLLC